MKAENSLKAMAGGSGGLGDKAGVVLWFVLQVGH